MQCKVLTALIVCAGSALPVLADTIHVAPCGDDSWTGASPDCAAPDGPKRTIQAGIDASVDGDIVLVADGTYTGAGNRDMDFGGRAIIVRGAGGAEACIIDCQGSVDDPHRAFYFGSGESNSSVLEGFTVRNGSMLEDLTAEHGGAVHCEFSSPLIKDCAFIGNTAYRGGAVWADSCDGVAIVGCTFSNNISPNQGGAIYFWESSASVADTTFSDNIADHGGGAIRSFLAGEHTYSRCSFLRNTAIDTAGNGGGAMQVSEGAVITWTECRFVENQSGRISGGIWISRASDATLVNCEFIGNSGATRASALGVSYGAQATLSNCLFASNAGEPGVGALWVGDGVGDPASATIVNCTFSRNGGVADSGLYVSQTSSLVATNCIYWDNAMPILTEPGTSVTISHSDIEGGWGGPGNMNADPLFADPNSGDYSLSTFSPCIDSGDNTSVQPGVLTDLGGGPRFYDDPGSPDTGIPGGGGGSIIVDMGALEFRCAADLNGDGLVDFADYLEFLNLYDAGDLRADFNGDGLVDFADYLEFLNHYDAGC